MSECKHIKAFFRVNEEHSLKPINRSPSGLISLDVLMHDLFHHFPNDTGLVEDELRAFGALIYISNGNYLDLQLRKYDYMSLVDQITSLLTYKELTCFKQCQRNATIKNVEDYNIINNVKEELLSKSQSYWFRNGFEAAPTYHELLNIIRWVVKGYNQAKRRYIGITQEDLSSNYYDMLYSLKKFKLYEGYLFVDANIETAELQLTNLGYLHFAEWDEEINKYAIRFEFDSEFFKSINPIRFETLCQKLGI